jgi:hypothetical protein
MALFRASANYLENTVKADNEAEHEAHDNSTESMKLTELATKLETQLKVIHFPLSSVHSMCRIVPPIL